MKNCIHKAKLEEFYSEYSYAHYLDSTINISFYLLCHEYVHLCIHLYPSVHLLSHNLQLSVLRLATVHFYLGLPSICCPVYC